VRRPIPVTASAIVALLGSILTLLFAVLMVVGPFIASPPPSAPPNTVLLGIGAALMFGVLGGIGVWTSVGLWRLRPWARTSILIFAGFLAAWSVFMVLMMGVMPTPPDTSAESWRTIRAIMLISFAIPSAIGVWWLFQFNTQSTKTAFTSPTFESASRIPLSIAIIGWIQVVGGVLTVIPLVAGMPVLVGGMAVTGWTARFFYLLVGAFSLWIGKGLLDLREKARVAAIAWFVVSFIHTTLILYVPSWWQRMVEMEQARSQTASLPLDQRMFANVIGAASAVVWGVAIWCLIRNRPAFARPEYR
jgi:hypothetical protein